MGILAAAISNYGAMPAGEGIIHQRFEIATGQPPATRIADAWTDTSNPGRHRMQIAVNNVVQEWQAGDGAGSLRYLSTGSAQNCGRGYPASGIRAGQLNRWSMSAADQAVMRMSRWQYGFWAIGRRYLEQARAAERLRSLGMVADGSHQILTLAAEGPEIDGTLLLKLDANDLILHEVREVTVEGGSTSTLVPWRLVSSQQIDPGKGQSSGLLSRLPLQPRPQEYARPMPILDPACPLWDINHAYSLTNALSQGTTPIVGLGQVPAGIERVYLAGRYQGGEQVDGENDYLRLIYVGAGKRLTFLALPGLTTPAPSTIGSPGVVATGPWFVQARAIGVGELRGDARPATAIARREQPAFWFVAEGWTRAEVMDLLASAHRLDLGDIGAQRPVLYEPGPGSPASAGAVAGE
jgi:hypothetical protein